MFNNKMNILKALGIIAVVAGHSGTNFFRWFPVYSYHMPLFMFISGYFFHKEGIFAGIKKKFKKLIIPFLAWNLFYGILINFLKHYGLVKFGHNLSLKSLFWEPFTGGWAFVFNGPAWFIGTLFFVQIFYLLLKKCFDDRNYVVLCLCFLLHLVSLHMAYNGYSAWFYKLGIAIERVLFCLIFYHIGQMYAICFENRDKFSLNKLISVFVVNAVVLGFISNHITCNIHQMRFPNHKILLPLLVACTGIYMCLQLADLLKDKIERESILSYIGENTFSIMMHHQFFFYLFNSVLLLIKELNILNLNTFDKSKYLSNIYFRVSAHYPVNDLLYLLVGIFGPLGCVYVVNVLKNKLRDKKILEINCFK